MSASAMQPQQSTKEQGLLGRLCAGDKKLEGKTFYLDNVKKRSTTLLLEAIPLLGGKVESFLHKDVTFVVTGSQESLKEEKKGEEKGTNEGSQHLMKKPDNCLSKDKQPPVNPRLVACGSRGKALLEKAICNNERQQRSSVLSNARSWGVKILYVDDVLLYLKHLSRESFSAKPKRPEKSSTKQSVPAVKATALRAPYLKIEDANRKYKPLHMQSVAFPSLYFLGRFSPFESPPPPLFGQGNDKKRENKVENNSKEKSPTQLSCNPSPWRPRRKDASYCECCRETFANLEEHLQSDAHRSFVLDDSNYESVDQIVAAMLPGFDPNLPQQPEQSRALTPLPVDELELCTDAEVEDAVQDLKRDDSNQADLKFTSRNVSSDPTDSHVQPEASSPTMPVLTIEPLDQQLDTSCPDAPDPYSLPPVLSPQVPHSHSIMDPHSPYPEPPILSPQKFSSEETHGLQTCGSALPLPLLLPAFSDGLEEEKGVKFPTRPSSRWSSFPRLSAAAPNPRKRCRSASPEHRSSKRRRTAENGRFPLKPQTDNMANAVDRLLFDPVRQRFPETLSSFSVSAAQNFTPTLFQIDSADFGFPGDDKKPPAAISDRDAERSHPHSASECIEPALIPDLATRAAESSDSDWDRDLLSAPAPPVSGELDKELLHRPCPWMHDSSYESHLHTVLQPAAALCGEDVDPATFSRTVVQIVEVQH
ncbi:protein DBF4 homolog B isoform X1 [Poecilia latipinna]|nr:PREDICTED: protein DBF4 homolog B-like isoform X1 [Poecilia latipinna]